jgi:hypothetical protein
MSWYELLLSLHVLAAAAWFGSGLAITVTAYRALAAGREAFGAVQPAAGWWAGRAHPAAGVVLLLTGFGLVAEADIGLGEPWIVLGLVGLVALFAFGGAFVGRTSDDLSGRIAEAGGMTEALLPLAERLLLFTRIESAVLALVIVNMVVKPGG